MRRLSLILALSIPILTAQEESTSEQPKKAAGIGDLLEDNSEGLAEPHSGNFKFDTATFETDSKGNLVLAAKGNIRIQADNGLQIFADRAIAHQSKGTIVLSGNVTMYQNGLVYRRKERLRLAQALLYSRF